MKLFGRRERDDYVTEIEFMNGDGKVHKTSVHHTDAFASPTLLAQIAAQIAGKPVNVQETGREVRKGGR